MRLRATRKSQPVTKSIGVSRRYASTSSIEHILQKVFGVRVIRDPAANKAAQPGPLFGNDIRDLSVLLDHRDHARWPTHLLC